MNAFDAMVVLVSFGFQTHSVRSGGKGQTSFLGVLRFVRLLRLFVVMNKIQSRREQYKRSRHLQFNYSPAERVMKLLAGMKARVAARADTKALVVDIDWIINLIISEKLYSIELKTDKVDGEMSAFLLGTVGGRKKKEAERDTSLAPEPVRGLRSGPRRRSSVKMVRISAQALEDAMAIATRQQAAASDKEVEADPREFNRLEAILLDPVVQDAVAGLDSWGVDVFDFHEKTHNSGLVAGAHHLMRSYGLIDRFNLDVPKMVAYFRSVQEGYRSNPYHNCVHALDVMLNTSYFMRQEAIAKLFTPLDQLAAILAAAIHDHGHPGLNNQFLIATRHEWAVRYSDQSVLESHHIASAWALLLQVRFQWFHSVHTRHAPMRACIRDEPQCAGARCYTCSHPVPDAYALPG
jgi:cAMP-specific phosphodiesterase 4